ncbi:hypothetical protein GGI12_001998 [Dipsacomyces acuminosporus]|nr:hypothetical protein GGI12_001998 [Dipsacomyces acuminosporus]
MSQSSLAQSLLAEILEEVIFHTTGLRRARGSSYFRDCAELCKELIPFLGVCTHWRSVAVPVFYTDMDLSISYELMKASKPKRLVHSMHDVISSRAEGVIRCAKIDAPFETILDGRIVELLSSGAYADAVFPSVHLLNFTIYNFSALEVEEAVFKDNALLLCKRIKQMFPNIKSLQATSHLRKFEHNYHNLLSSVFAGLASARLRAFSYSSYKGVLHIQGFRNLVNLTHVSLVVDHNYLDIVELMHRNALTLECANLCSRVAEAFVRMVVKADGATAIYPRLKTLSVSGDNYRHDCLALPEGVPFPALKHLTCNGGYPFSNDVFFKGNDSTLESLKFRLNSNLVQAITQLNVLAPGRYPRLSSITLRIWASFHMDEALALGVVRVPFELGPQVEKVSIRFLGRRAGGIIMAGVRSSQTPHAIRTVPYTR